MKISLTSPKLWLAILASLIFGLGATVKGASLPTLSIVSPTSGQNLAGNSVTVKLQTTDFTLVDYTTHIRKVAGQGHIHLWLDQTTPLSKTSAIKIFSDSYTFDNLKAGSHTLTAELVNNDHSSMVPPVMTTVDFNTGVAAKTNSMPTQFFLVAIFGFLFVILVLFFVTNQFKSGSNSGKQPRKSSSKSSKRSSRK